MQFPVNIGLRRSRLLHRTLWLSALAGAITAFLIPESLMWQLGLLALIGVLTASARARLDPPFDQIRFLANGQIEVADDQAGFRPVSLLPGQTVHPWLTVFRLEENGLGPHALVITVDSLSTQDFRRLRVLLRWQPTVKSLPDAA